MEINNAPVMEEAEYIDYLRNQLKDTETENTPVAQLNLYQMNKDLVKDLKKMNNMDVNRALEKVKEWYIQSQKNNNLECYHYAFLNHEQHYFTLFERPKENLYANEPDRFIKELKDVLTNYYGDNDIRAIDVVNEDAVEIWAMWNKEPTVAYLFPYEKGVVYY